MSGKWVPVLVVAMILVASCVYAASSAGQRIPATLERVTGNRVWSYVLFGLMGASAVLLIYRGIRAR
jgi:hypothetical protein